MTLNDRTSLKTLPAPLAETILSGMRSPRAVKLGVGEVLYRFASSDAPEATWIAGTWRA
jgi:hypothetical protein